MSLLDEKVSQKMGDTMRYSIITAAGLVFILASGCGTADEQSETAAGAEKYEQNEAVVKEAPTEVKSVSTNEASEQTDEARNMFSEVAGEKADEYLNMLGEPADNVELIFGTAEEKGSFEGAEYEQYGEFTFFIDSNDQTVQALAYQPSGHSLTTEEIKEAAGEADESYYNDMDQLWTEVYTFDTADIIIEKSDKSSSKVEYMWYETK
ncbi:hypothetical protein [Alteribacillus sp. HJP-4]|uniref:hypothetical protein n=1 Tax=Alteribacillus sp. HJP-4 TaxID=2775394 RepID=UPI0035CD22FD